MKYNMTYVMLHIVVYNMMYLIMYILMHNQSKSKCNPRDMMYQYTTIKNDVCEHHIIHHYIHHIVNFNGGLNILKGSNFPKKTLVLQIIC